MSNNDRRKPGPSRRDLLSTAAAATGAFVIAIAAKLWDAGAVSSLPRAATLIAAWFARSSRFSVTIKLMRAQASCATI